MTATPNPYEECQNVAELEAMISSTFPLKNCAPTLRTHVTRHKITVEENGLDLKFQRDNSVPSVRLERLPAAITETITDEKGKSSSEPV